MTPTPAAAGRLERRAFDFDFRSTSDGDKPMMRGHAAVFHTAADLGSYSEEIEPGAFTKTIGSSDIRCLWNHNPDIVLGRNRSGTLTLSEDETGLYIECDPPDTTWGRDLSTLMLRGDITQMSIGFYTIGYRTEKRDGTLFRILTECQLLDVSPVTYPAYTSTDIALRSTADILDELQHLPMPEEEVPAEPDDPEPDWEARLAVYHRRLTLCQ